MPYFFFSYAVENAGASLTRFLNDLRSLVCKLAPCRPADACFNDWDQRPGDDYPDNIQQSLASSGVMIAVYSPNYFQKPFCGMEFQVFLDRRKAHRQKRPGSKPLCIIPIMWVPSQEHITYPARPFFVSRRQDSNYHAIYEERGLEFILEQGVDAPGERRDWYVDFKFKIAQQVVDAAVPYPLEPAVALNMGAVKNAFDARPAKVAQDLAQLKLGPNSATFLYVGHPDWEWSDDAPYPPVRQNRTGFVSVAVAESKEIEPQKIQFVPDSNATFEMLDKLREGNGRVVVLVNNRSMQEATHLKWLKDFDQRRYSHCATVVVGPDGVAQSDEEKIFGNSRSGLFFNFIPNAERLGFNIDKSLEVLRVELSNRGTGNSATGSALPSF